MDRRDYRDMEYFIELNNLLKDAGAKRVWIHPSEKWDKKANMSELIQSIREMSNSYRMLIIAKNCNIIFLYKIYFISLQ